MNAEQEDSHPLWRVWEASGKEMAWINANRRQDRKTYRILTKEEYTALIAKHPGAPGISVQHQEDEDGNRIEDETPSYYEVLSSIETPTIGARIYCQTGCVAISSSSFQARVYRGTWNGTKWFWEVSKECYARHLRERVDSLLDEDYQPTDSAPYSSPTKDWLVTKEGGEL